MKNKETELENRIVELENKFKELEIKEKLKLQKEEEKWDRYRDAITSTGFCSQQRRY
jgi:hypothetical protein